MVLVVVLVVEVVVVVPRVEVVIDVVVMVVVLVEVVVVLDVVVVVVVVGGTTVTPAVGPVGVTGTDPASALALLRYVPAIAETVTVKCSDTLPAAGTVNGPDHVRVCADTAGSLVVTPLVDPVVYVKPAGRTSLIEVRFTPIPPGLLTVIV